SFTVNVPATGLTSTAGVAQVVPVGTNSFNINVPGPVYNPSTGALSTGSVSTNITQTLALTGNMLTVGQPGNAIMLPPSNVTVQGTGIANVNPLSGDNFTIDVAMPNFQGS